jgi:putative ABC transport system substrate-binding protein
MKRREFITLLGGATAAWPLAARAQQTQRPRRIGILMGVADDAETKAWLVTFNQRLEQLGWQAGHNLQIDERWTAGDPERNLRFAGELLAMQPDAVFAFSSVAVAALQGESRTGPDCIHRDLRSGRKRLRAKSRPSWWQRHGLHRPTMLTWR